MDENLNKVTDEFITQRVSYYGKNETEEVNGAFMELRAKVERLRESLTSVEVSEAILYADDAVAESLKEFKSGKITLNTDDLSYEVQGLLLGHTVTPTTLKANANDTAPFVGVGFYGSVVRNNTVKYRAIWLYKNKFSEFNDESKTKGENIEFTTPTIEGTIMKMPNGDWKEEQLFIDEAEAMAWLDGKAGITGGVIDDGE